jgi:hypothetical protein
MDKIQDYIQTLPKNKKFSKYIDLYFSNKIIKLKYDPTPIQRDDFDSFEMDYISNHFIFSSRKNLIFRKFHEDIYEYLTSKRTQKRKSSLKPYSNKNAKRVQIKGGGIASNIINMDGYGLCIDSKIKIDKEILCSFINALNILPIAS